MSAPKYRKHVSGQARVTINGRDIYLGKWNSKASRQAYKRLINELDANGGVLIPDEAIDDLVLSEMFLAYRGYAKGHYGTASGEFDRIERIMRIVQAAYGKTAVSKFRYKQFVAIRQSLVAGGSGRKYINESMGRLIRIFVWSAGCGMIEPIIPQALKMIDPLERRRTAAPEPIDVEPVSSEVVERTLPMMPPIVADMVRFQVLVGCRPGETCKIKPEMIDRSGDIWELRLLEHKTDHKGKLRTLYIGPQAQKILGPYLLRASDAYCFSPQESEAKRLAARHDARVTPLSCGNRRGSNRRRKPRRSPRDHYDCTSYRRAIQRACDLAWPVPDGLDDDKPSQWRKDHRWAPNQLRHSFGTLVRKAEGIEAARVLLGRSRLSTTEIYAERDRQAAIDAALRIG